jgi:hypothetical protein
MRPSRPTRATLGRSESAHPATNDRAGLTIAAEIGSVQASAWLYGRLTLAHRLEADAGQQRPSYGGRIDRVIMHAAIVESEHRKACRTKAVHVAVDGGVLSLAWLARLRGGSWPGGLA